VTRRVEVSVLLRRPANPSLPSEQDLLSGQYQPAAREQAAEAMSADPQDLSAVRAFAHNFGLTVVDENASKRRVVLAGITEQMERAFGVKLERAHDSQGNAYLTHRGSLSIPKPLAGIVTAVLGLDERPIARPRP
jgi:kumamolisin